MKVQCMVCKEKPIIQLKQPSDYYEGYIEHCPVCTKHIGQVYSDYTPFGEVLEWSLEEDEYLNEDTNIIYKDYRIKYIDV